MPTKKCPTVAIHRSVVDGVSIRPKSMAGGASGNPGSVRVEYRFGVGDAAEEMEGYYDADEE
jgi:hypothetical protein